MPKKNRSLTLYGPMLLLMTAVELLACFSLELYRTVIAYYACPAALLFIGCVLLIPENGFRRDAALPGLLMLLWLAVCQTKAGTFAAPNGLITFAMDVLAFGFAYRFAAIDGDRRLLPAAAALICTVGAVIGVLALLCAFRGQSIVLKTGTVFDIEEGRVLVNTMHPNALGAVMNIVLMMSVYLWRVCKKAYVRIPLAALMLLSFAVIAFTVSRTVMIVCSLELGALCFLWLMRKPFGKKALRIVLSAVLCLCVIAVSYLALQYAVELPKLLNVGNKTEAVQAAEPAESADTAAADDTESAAKADPKTEIAARPLMKDLATMTGRTGIYKGVIRYLIENPKRMLLGTETAKLSAVYKQYTGRSIAHSHNTWLQTVLQYGLPALLIALVITVQAVIACVRCCFDPYADKLRDTDSVQVLCALCIGTLINALTEPLLFCGFTAIIEFAFFLSLGYILQSAERIRTRHAVGRAMGAAAKRKPPLATADMDEPRR